MTKKNDWFRSSELTDYLSELRAQNLFANYPAVGASMGGPCSLRICRKPPGAAV